MTAAHKDPAIVARGSTVIAEMKDICPSMIYAALVTDDGFTVVHLPHHETDSDRFASMASSMQALTDAVARELQMGDSQYIIIASDRYHVIQLRVPGQALVLSVLFDDDETLGKALSISRQSASRLASAMAEPVS